MFKFISKYLRQRRYNKYMRSTEWANLRKRVLARDDYKCFLCETKSNLEVHHLIYPKNIYESKMYQCVTLCKKHHRKIHGKLHYEN